MARHDSLFFPPAANGWAHPGYTPRPTAQQAARQEHGWRLFGLWILFGAALYQMALCLVHTHVFAVRTAMVGAAEFVLYLGCLLVLARRLQLDVVAILSLCAAYLLLLALLRGSLDAKGFRDLLIVLLFYWLGRSVGDVRTADRFLRILIGVVLLFGFFEMFFVEYYSRVFNVFSYYVSQGGLRGTNWIKDNTLALNSMRPEGIGRTILPGLLGAHRVSSIFLEPVSLGNFAVITAAWGLSKEKTEWRWMLFFVGAAMLMITLADSRYGLMTISCLILMRLAFRGRMHYLLMFLPLVCVLMLIGIALFLPDYHGDNMLGRLRITGVVLSEFGIGELMGLKGYNLGFGDMGYAVLLTRFGLPFFVALWIGFWMIRMKDEQGIRFRAYAALYMSLILAISGTSLMALKTAGVLWFLIGCCALREKPAVARGFADTPAPQSANRKASHVS
ncbi:hypothetical protein GCM10007205_12600 [Oxalicibacterium flavum]|uniref:Polysaccharide polymerase n=1 Tax=Oxalicibacterium flavum TaxID=179467 RepID=A0A8J2UM20_9BURK|nr:polysaccharide polymerase [Oxalicibacterium flavum]GGC04887.1 hypothetical protein GCM10007205_12600 [Oxalicibacterium flavum]